LKSEIQSTPLILDRIPVLAETDIIIVAAGFAGCAATIAAREGGIPDRIIDFTRF
jgi:NADPH-dependent 2,4-dienoyl-CoA reductase/sulfur reductase-like enzyme